jgi:Leucine-rich repeat (LRR) protein
MDQDTLEKQIKEINSLSYPLLDLQSVQLSDENLRYISTSLRTSLVSIIKVVLNDVTLPGIGAAIPYPLCQVVAAQLGLNKTIVSLYLDNSVFGRSCLKFLLTALNSNLGSSLTILSLANNNIAARDCKILAEVMSNPHLNLCSVSLKDNCIGDFGAIDLLAGIRCAYKLQTLELSGNGITALGVHGFVGWQANDLVNLRELDLSNNPIGDIGAINLAAHISRIKCKKIDLSGCHISNIGMRALATAAAGNKYLEELVLNNNLIDDFAALAPLLTSKNLCRLHLRSNRIRVGVDAFAIALVGNVTLEFLDLRDNNIDDSQSQGIVKIAGFAEGLRELLLANNQFTEECITLLSGMLLELPPKRKALSFLLYDIDSLDDDLESLSTNTSSQYDRMVKRLRSG